MSDAIVIRCYDDLIEAMRARIAELGLTMETLDALTGLQTGYCAKLLGPARIKTLGVMSLDLLLQTLALQLMPSADPEMTAKMKGRWEGRERPFQSPPNRLSKQAMERVTPIVMRELGRLGGLKGGLARASNLTEVRRKRIAQMGGKAVAKKLTAQQRQDRARRAALSRWNKP